jgi:1,4-alpha-glucan branching enzyme
MLLRDLNALYKDSPELYEQSFYHQGFEWIDFSDSANSVISWLRKAKNGDAFMFICSFTPVVRHNYRVGVPKRGYYTEVLNSDATQYGGSGVRNAEKIDAAPIPKHGRSHSIVLTLPPLAVLILKWKGPGII